MEARAVLKNLAKAKSFPWMEDEDLYRRKAELDRQIKVLQEFERIDAEIKRIKESQ